MKFLQWLKMVLRRFRAQGVHYIGGSDVLPPPLSPEEEAAAQQTLFSSGGEEKRARLERLARTTDAIRAKYGQGAIGMASEPRDAARERHAPPPSGARRGED